jgi:hypothetical protein
MVVGLLFLHRKAGRLILVLCSGERGGQIGSWPTAQAETSNPQVCRKSGNPAFKGPETLDTALDSLHEKSHTDITPKATWGCLPPARHKPTQHTKFYNPAQS